MRRSCVVLLGPGSIGHPGLAASAVALMVFLAGCGVLSNETPPPWKGSPPPIESPAPEVTPDAAGVVPGCPVTLGEVRAAVPDIVRGPDVGIPFKNVIQNCGFSFPGTDLLGRSVGVSILVFDAQGAGSHLWDDVRTDPNFPNATDIAGLGDVAFVTGTPHFTDLWSVQGQIGLHIYTLREQGLTVAQFTALTRAAFDRLKP